MSQVFHFEANEKVFNQFVWLMYHGKCQNNKTNFHHIKLENFVSKTFRNRTILRIRFEGKKIKYRKLLIQEILLIEFC